MSKLHTISQQLSYMTKHGSWEPRGDWTEAEITELRFQAANELRRSTLGQQLSVRGGENIFNDVLEEFGKRAHPPSVAPFYETLVQVARDILVTLPAEADLDSTENVAVGPTPEEIQRGKELLARQDAVRDARIRELKKFAYMANAAIEYGGIQCIKPCAGVVTLKFALEDGRERRYEYSGAELEKFRNDFEEATGRGLIR